MLCYHQFDQWCNNICANCDCSHLVIFPSICSRHGEMNILGVVTPEGNVCKDLSCAQSTFNTSSFSLQLVLPQTGWLVITRHEKWMSWRPLHLKNFNRNSNLYKNSGLPLWVFLSDHYSFISGNAQLCDVSQWSLRGVLNGRRTKFPMTLNFRTESSMNRIFKSWIPTGDIMS